MQKTGCFVMCKQKNLFEATEYLPCHTQAGIQEGHSFLAFDILQTCLDRAGQTNGYISLPPLLSHVYCSESMP